MYKRNLKLRNMFVGIILIIIIIEIIRDPSKSISSARDGLNIWFNILLPSIFPFILITDLLISFGLVEYLAKFLEIIMRPLFNVSGVGIFPLSMSVMSGYPVGSKLTSKLREENFISNIEANRLITFSSTSGPLFILGTVMIGMLGASDLGLLLLLPHYLGAFTIGIIFSFYKSNSSDIINPRVNSYLAKREAKSIGSIISKSIKDSMDSLILIGGFIIIYSVIIDILLSSSVFNLILGVLSKITTIETTTLKGLVAGIIEITKGCEIISSLNISLINRILLLNFIIGWGGLSIHSQAISYIGQTDISTKIYLFAKVLHGLFSTSYTYLIYLIFYKGKLLTTFNFPAYHTTNINSWLIKLTSSTKLILSLLLFLIILSSLIKELKRRA